MNIYVGKVIVQMILALMMVGGLMAGLALMY
jgi:hypothetical protein